MLVSTKGRYALRLMMEIATKSDNRPVSIKEVSQTQDLPAKYLEQLVRPLAKAKLLKSVRGQHGGYILARPVSEISVGEIIRASEGDVAPVYCLEDNAEICPRRAFCTTLSFWEGLDNVINEYLDSYTLERLCSADLPLDEQ